MLLGAYREYTQYTNGINNGEQYDKQPDGVLIVLRWTNRTRKQEMSDYNSFLLGGYYTF